MVRVKFSLYCVADIREAEPIEQEIVQVMRSDYAMLHDLLKYPIHYVNNPRNEKGIFTIKVEEVEKTKEYFNKQKFATNRRWFIDSLLQYGFVDYTKQQEFGVEEVFKKKRPRLLKVKGQKTVKRGYSNYG